MSRKGHYHGGGTAIGRKDSDYFTRDSMLVPKDDGRPDRLSTAGTVRFAAPYKGPESELIKAGDLRLKKEPRKHK